MNNEHPRQASNRKDDQPLVEREAEAGEKLVPGGARRISRYFYGFQVNYFDESAAARPRHTESARDDGESGQK